MFGWIKNAFRRVADFTRPIALGVGRFVQQHHVPLAALAKSVGDASGNPLAQNLGNLAAGASAAYALRQRLNAFNNEQQQQQRDRTQ